MKILKIFLLILLSIFTILFSLVFMLNLGLERTLLNIDHYRSITHEFDLFDQIHENLEEELIPQEVPEEEIDEEGQEMLNIIREVFEPQWLQEQTLMVLEDVLTYTKGQSEELTSEIDLTERKELIESKIAETIAQQEDVPMGEAQEMAQEVIAEIELPENIVLSEILPEEAEGIIDTVILVRSYSVIASIAILVLVLLFMLLFGGLSGGLKWFGASMLIPGSVLLVALIGFNSSININLVRNFVDIPTGFAFIIDVLRYTIRQIYLIPGLYSATGLILIVLGSIIGKKGKREVTPGESVNKPFGEEENTLEQMETT